ncbi:spore germination protein [Sporosarcina sp. JAI121]|uniref:spore germination protein n=1 Tax=Sporosarcina sp. JAI121 TaxID=2723064 RepID=UPI0015CA4A24|nr:spore germination protein [Sporosarcina sp. JAI121]NYF25472.1 hypothetical protein [Sporosarcina sp. JAI121]
MSFSESDKNGFSNETSIQNDNVLLDAIKNKLNEVEDAVFKNIQTADELVTIIYLSSLIEKLTLHRTVIAPLLTNKEDLLKSAEVPEKVNISSILSSITEGNTIVYFQSKNLFSTVNTYSPPTSSIANSDTESTVSGPRDAFTESLQTNLSLVKRRIQNTRLKNRDYIIGTETNTKVSVLYIEKIVNDNNLTKVINKIEAIDYRGFNDITILAQLMEDHQFSPFPQYQVTERPDMVTSSLIDGRVVIMMNNSIGAVICPSSFLGFFMSPEDYYNRWTTATLLRCIRFFGFFLTIMLTPFYISALSHHPEMLPYEVLKSLYESRSRVPFPPVIEVLFMELVIEVLREAGSRMPTKIGQTIGIVGGIVIGTAAVEAGLVSNILIVLVAISALLSFLPPSYKMSNASRFVRYIFILSAGFFGLYGQMIAFAWLIYHLVNLTSLGTPFMSPVIPRKWTDLLDSIVLAPTSFLKHKKGVASAESKKVLPENREE